MSRTERRIWFAAVLALSALALWKWFARPPLRPLDHTPGGALERLEFAPGPPPPRDVLHH